ncbi:S9 family peptidase [Actinopolymorpha singaporensis]|uniref:Oligopeptidase B n=1 Tax=Actinopolymorpha singaporensis TaxID=117157 RepID=A0A1H1VQR1_9ACTN|nr:S9 family peptidase [Actinopolymorpha singaporensis]SDS87015.1 oligopeptidase B [Actinopolymorpha singaporensis]
MPTAPRPEQRPFVHRHHGDERVDEYAWLRDREDPAVLAHLKAENAHTEESLAHLAGLREELFEEYRSRIKETDEDVPARDGAWEYFTRTQEGKQYPLFVRQPVGGVDGDSAGAGDREEVLLDCNEAAEGTDYFALGAFAVSPSGHLLAYSVDTDGSEEFRMRVKDLRTGEHLPDTISPTGYGAAWSADEGFLFYTTLDPAHRPWKLWRHRLGTDQSEDVLIFTEEDESFYLGISRTRSREWLVLDLHATESSEVHVLPTDDPEGQWRLVAARRPGVEYSLEHHTDRFLFVTNDQGPDFRLAQAPVEDPSPERWTDVIPHQEGVRIVSVDAFTDHLVVALRADGRTELDVITVADAERRRMIFEEPIYTVDVGTNREFDTTTLRIDYTSLTTPNSVIDVDLATDARRLRKRQPVLNVDLDRYQSTREWATAPDGTKVPISLVWRDDRPEGGPVLLYGYGSYEHSMDPWFSTLRLSLLDRGVAFAIAHVRGGGELGRSWYEHGKRLEKANTFTDFVAAADYLVDNGWTTRDGLAIRGGSAGGLLVGAVLNLRPDLCAAAVAEVPFVDALTTILDPSLPLTVREWDEWGNPVADPRVYAAMKAYSPFDNVSASRYPAIYATAGLNDPRVSYWEPAKWVARLRDRMTGGGPVLLKTELGAGHGGPSGRYDAWRDEAQVHAFVLDQVGVAKTSA